MPKLSERALLASLHVSVWGGTTHDKNVTAEVSEGHKADAKDAGAYHKRLISRNLLRQVSGQQSVARNTHRVLTLPWSDDGTRILSTTMHARYTEAMQAHRVSFESAVRTFIKEYPEYIKEAQVRLGTMFDASDYPSPAELEEKFGIDIELLPIPEAQDFRAKLSDNTVNSIVKDIERRTKQRMQLAMDDVFKRIAEVTQKMVEGLRRYDSKEGGRFNDSLVFNISELADMIPALNLTDDPKLIKLHEQLKKDLGQNGPEILRADANKRKQTADKAEKIFNKVKQFLA